MFFDGKLDINNEILLRKKMMNARIKQMSKFDLKLKKKVYQSD